MALNCVRTTLLSPRTELALLKALALRRSRSAEEMAYTSEGALIMIAPLDLHKQRPTANNGPLSLSLSLPFSLSLIALHSGNCELLLLLLLLWLLHLINWCTARQNGDLGKQLVGQWAGDHRGQLGRLLSRRFLSQCASGRQWLMNTPSKSGGSLDGTGRDETRRRATQ